MPYKLTVGEVLAATGNCALHNAGTYMSTLTDRVLSSTQVNQARMAAYEKLKAKLSDRASMGENLIDVRKSLSTIETRAFQLFDFTRAVKKGRLGDAARILRTPMPKTKDPVKEQANNWLEYHLGIEPVVNDIYNAIDILQNPIKNVFVKGRGSVGGFMLRKVTTGDPWSANYQDWINKVRVEYRAEVAISNPNLYLANSLGLLNPVQVLWQVIPLSFVLDWFVNVEQFLGTASDFWGLTVLNPQTTVTYDGLYDEWWNTYGWIAKLRTVGMSRQLGFTLPSLGLRPYKATSWQRGLTAVSLLVGSLNSLDKTNYRPERRQLKLFKFERTLQSVVAPPYDWRHERRR